jgi:hypothetical protein
MQLLWASCLGSYNSPRIKGLTGTLVGGCHLIPFSVPTKSPQGIPTPCTWGKTKSPWSTSTLYWGTLVGTFKSLFPLVNLVAYFNFPCSLGNRVLGLNSWGIVCLPRQMGDYPRKLGLQSPFLPPKTTWLNISSLFVLSWSSFGPKFWGNHVFPRANGRFDEVLGPKTWSPRSKGLEIFKQVALERKALQNPNQVAPRMSSWCWGATPDPMLSATGIHTLPLLQNFNVRISCVWSWFWLVVSVLGGSIFFIGFIS